MTVACQLSSQFSTKHCTYVLNITAMLHFKFLMFALNLAFILLIYNSMRHNDVVALLLYPEFSVLQLTMGISIPVPDTAKHIHLSFDWAFQANYDFPYNLSSFYNSPIWPQRRHIRSNTTHDAQPSIYRDDAPGVHKNDLTAGELYTGLVQWLVSYGFHSTCLLRDVCEIALHPFDADKENLYTELLTFILSPSIHRAFSKSEDFMRQQYELAEIRGLEGCNCSALYPECDEHFLSIITKLF